MSPLVLLLIGRPSALMLTQVWWMRPSRNTFNPKLFVGVVRPKKEPSAIQMIRR